MPDTKVSNLTEATTLVDADLVPVVTDTGTVPASKKSKWSTVFTYIAAAWHAATAKTTPVDADELTLLDSAASFVAKRVTIANFKAAHKASGAEVDTGTEDAKFVTPKAIKDSHNVPSVAPSTAAQTLKSNGTDWISSPWVASPSTSATLASDTFTATSSFMTIDTEGAAATDNCSTINSGTAPVGTILVLRQANSARDITFVDGTSLKLNGNCVFTVINDTLTLILIGGNTWAELARSING